MFDDPLRRQEKGVCLQAQDLSFRYGDGPRVLEAVSFTLADGDFVALIGQNGSGKTTLAKHFIGLLHPTAGSALVYGQDTRDQAIGDLARTVGYVFQNPDHQIFSASVREEIAFGPRNIGLPAEVVTRRTHDALQQFGLEEVADRPPAMLSFGQRRKVSLASTVVMEPRLLILDEPTVGLDWGGARETMRILQQLNAGGRTIVLITHDLQLVAEFAKRCILLHAGKLVANDSTRSVFGRDDLMQSCGFSLPPVWELSRRLRDRGFGSPVMDVESFCSAYGAILSRHGT